MHLTGGMDLFSIILSILVSCSIYVSIFYIYPTSCVWCCSVIWLDGYTLNHHFGIPEQEKRNYTFLETNWWKRECGLIKIDIFSFSPSLSYVLNFISLFAILFEEQNGNHITCLWCIFWRVFLLFLPSSWTEESNKFSIRFQFQLKKTLQRENDALFFFHNIFLSILKFIGFQILIMNLLWISGG